MAAHNELGKWGERKAAAYLTVKGYLILNLDWKSGHRDLDIVATTPDENTLVFVEVKTRRDTVFAQPEQAVDWNKRHSLTLAANAYLRRYEVNKNIRFDIITVVGTNDNDVHIEHFENAFQPPSI